MSGFISVINLTWSQSQICDLLAEQQIVLTYLATLWKEYRAFSPRKKMFWPLSYNLTLKLEAAEKKKKHEKPDGCFI